MENRCYLSCCETNYIQWRGKYDCSVQLMKLAVIWMSFRQCWPKASLVWEAAHQILHPFAWPQILQSVAATMPSLLLFLPLPWEGLHVCPPQEDPLHTPLVQLHFWWNVGYNPALSQFQQRNGVLWLWVSVCLSELDPNINVDKERIGYLGITPEVAAGKLWCCYSYFTEK